MLQVSSFIWYALLAAPLIYILLTLLKGKLKWNKKHFRKDPKPYIKLAIASLFAFIIAFNPPYKMTTDTTILKQFNEEVRSFEIKRDTPRQRYKAPDNKDEIKKITSGEEK